MTWFAEIKAAVHSFERFCSSRACERNCPGACSKVMVLPGWGVSAKVSLYDPLLDTVVSAGYSPYLVQIHTRQWCFGSIIETHRQIVRQARAVGVIGAVGHSYGGLQALLLSGELGLPAVAIGAPVGATDMVLTRVIQQLVSGKQQNGPMRLRMQSKLAKAAKNSLVIAGERDMIAPPHACELPGAQYRLVDACHMDIVRNPDALRAVGEFLVRARPRRLRWAS